MRTVSDEVIEAQAKQPDIQYLSTVQLMDVADSFNYSYDDYVAFANAARPDDVVPWYTESVYKSHRESIREQAAEYLAACVDAKNSILAQHW